MKIPDETIEAAARAVNDTDSGLVTVPWDDLTVYTQDEYRTLATAALPHITLALKGNQQMKPQKFTKRPVTIEAMQYAGTPSECMDVYRWVEANTLGSFDVNELWEDPENFTWPSSGVSIDARDGRMVIATLEGGHWVNPGDWIVRGVVGEFYPCKPEIFANTYVPAEGTQPTTDTEDRVLKIARELARAYPITLSTGRELAQIAMEFSALDVIERVREIHQPIEALNTTVNRVQKVCLGCGQDNGNWNTYPCPTIRALDRIGTRQSTTPTVG